MVLNHFTGGLNPCAVENAVKLGARQIWLPSVDAMGHVKVYGHPGGYGYQESGTVIQRNGITISNADGELTKETKAIVQLVMENESILGTGHISRDEIFILAKHCQKQGFKRLLVTHPYFNPPQLKVEDQMRLAEMGASIELCGGNLYPIPGTANLSNYQDTVSKVDTNALVISSDAGQPRKSMPAEVLRVFTQCLMEKGVTQEQIDIMTKRNPARLLGL